MRKTLKRSVLGIIILTLAIMLPYFIFKMNTKSFSPEDTITYQDNGLQLEVFYNRPYKKNREIFGGLVPYDKVWRTGANEATTFKTSKDILVDGSLLKEGKYTLWTIPGQESWKVIFNSEMYPWGITADELPSRQAQYDVLTVEVPVHHLKNIIEQFTIDFDKEFGMINMNLLWDQILIKIPISPA
ncbi:MAG: DUF2911 domain-containing protein [Salinimicrobium sp.]